MKAKLVKENLNDNEFNFPLSDVTFDDLINAENDNSVNLPVDFMSSRLINTLKRFDEWYDEFTGQYGTEGVLVGKPFYGRLDWELKGNSEWDVHRSQGSEDMERFQRGSGNWTGD